MTHTRNYRARTPEIWNSLDHATLQQQIEGFIPLRKQLQSHIISQAQQKSQRGGGMKERKKGKEKERRM